MKIADARRDSRGCYDPADLQLFRSVSREILAAIVRAQDFPLDADVADALRLRVAAAVFECADDGEIDRDSIKRRVLARFCQPSASSASAYNLH